MASPIGKLRERPTELPFKAGDVDTAANAVEALEHQRHLLTVLSDLVDWRLGKRDRRPSASPNISSVGVTVIAVIAAISGVSMAACLVRLVLSPAIMVIAYEIRGFEHMGGAALAD